MLQILKRIEGKCLLTGRSGQCVVICRDDNDFEPQTVSITQLPTVLKLLMPLESETNAGNDAKNRQAKPKRVEEEK